MNTFTVTLTRPLLWLAGIGLVAELLAFLLGGLGGLIVLNMLLTVAWLVKNRIRKGRR